MQAVSLSQARVSLMELVDRVVADKTPIAITRKRGEGVVLVPESEWLSLRATLNPAR